MMHGYYMVTNHRGSFNAPLTVMMHGYYMVTNHRGSFNAPLTVMMHGYYMVTNHRGSFNAPLTVMMHGYSMVAMGADWYSMKHRCYTGIHVICSNRYTSYEVCVVHVFVIGIPAVVKTY